MNAKREQMRQARVRAMLKNEGRYNDEEKAWLASHRHLVEGGPNPAHAQRPTAPVEDAPPKTSKSARSTKKKV